MFRVAPKVDAGFENLLFAENRTAELKAVLVAVSSIGVEHSITQDFVSRADQEDTAEFHTVEDIVFDHNILRPHLDAGVIKHDAEMPEGIILRRPAIDTGIA